MQLKLTEIELLVIVVTDLQLNVFTSRKAGQHVLLVQGGTGGGGGTFSFLETSVHVKPLENL